MGQYARAVLVRPGDVPRFSKDRRGRAAVRPYNASTIVPQKHQPNNPRTRVLQSRPFGARIQGHL